MTRPRLGQSFSQFSHDASEAHPPDAVASSEMDLDYLRRRNSELAEACHTGHVLRRCPRAAQPDDADDRFRRAAALVGEGRQVFSQTSSRPFVIPAAQGQPVAFLAGVVGLGGAVVVMMMVVVVVVVVVVGGAGVGAARSDGVGGRSDRGRSGPGHQQQR